MHGLHLARRLGRGRAPCACSPRRSLPQLEEIQRAYEEKQMEEEQLGGHRPPACPQCGHHTVAVKLHRSHAAT